MGNQNSFVANKKTCSTENKVLDHFEIFRRQSLHKSSNTTKDLEPMQYNQDNSNKSYSLYNLNSNKTSRKTDLNSSLKNQHLSNKNEINNIRNQSIVEKPNKKISNNNLNNKITRFSQVDEADQQLSENLNCFTSTLMQTNQHAIATKLNSKRVRSLKKSESVSQQLSINGREIIQFCWENASIDFGIRLCTRLFEKRHDFQKFSLQMGREKWFEMANNLRDFLCQAILEIDHFNIVEKLALKYGEDHLPLKCYGFKPDFWVTLADLLTVEGVMLDLATHTHSETVTAWSIFVSILFSSIRDGYYNAMRKQRNSIRKKNSLQKNLVNTKQLENLNDRVGSISPNESIQNNLVDSSNSSSRQDSCISINLTNTNENQLNNIF